MCNRYCVAVPNLAPPTALRARLASAVDARHVARRAGVARRRDVVALPRDNVPVPLVDRAPRSAALALRSS